MRAIAEVSTAVTQGDLTRSITVGAQGEVAELKDNINQMIANLRDTTTRNEEQDWLKTSLARISGLMQGQRELATVTQLIMSELTPTVSAQHGAFFLAESDGDGLAAELRLIASYGYTRRDGVPDRFGLGESLVGQAALERTTIRIDERPGLHPGQLRARGRPSGEHHDHADPVRGPGAGRDRAGVAAFAVRRSTAPSSSS